MAEYHFTTRWKFEAPLEKAWHEIKTMNQWPEWWKYIEKVELLRSGGKDDIGATRLTTWRTTLPYSFTVETELVELVEHQRIEGKARGELEGNGIWTFSTEDDNTIVQYDWMVKTNKPWMNWLAPIARPFFEWNHEKVMTAGYEGLRKRLSI